MDVGINRDTYASFAVICAELLREKALRHEIFCDFKIEMEPLCRAGSEFAPF
jgi:hypothetical protein